MPRLARFVRAHIVTTLAILQMLALVAVAVGLVLVVRLSNDIITARQRECASGNTVRGHIAFVDTTLRDILVIALAQPPPQPRTPAQLEVRRRFQEAVDKLSKRLPALLPRDCSKGAVSGAESAAPASR